MRIQLVKVLLKNILLVLLKPHDNIIVYRPYLGHSFLTSNYKSRFSLVLKKRWSGAIASKCCPFIVVLLLHSKLQAFRLLENVDIHM